MATSLSCPPGYVCTFRPIPHVYDPWWTGPWGIAVAGATLVALVVIVYIVTRYRASSRDKRLEIQSEREQRAHEAYIAEQHTMQLDAAKGNTEMLRVVRDMMKEDR